MKNHVLLRSLFALFSVIGSLWLTSHMPSGSAFATMPSSPTFEMWQGMILVGSLSMALYMARLLVRS